MSSANRYIFDVPLIPILGSTFQPTGFPDLGAATFERPVQEGGRTVLQRCLLVESVQSMANHLEGTTWNAGANTQVDALTGLSYVEVTTPTGEFLTSSRLEAHRLFSAFIRDSVWAGRPGDAVLLEHLSLKVDTPVSYPDMARVLLTLDPLSLLHGTFFAGGKPRAGSQRATWPTQPRFTRAVSAVIEAHGVHEVASGGRKSDSVRHSLGEDKATGGGTAEGYGSIPFHRTEYTAADIIATFVVDRGLLNSYGLPAAATHLLETLALWEIRIFLDSSLRLRTACALELRYDAVTDRRSREPLPDAVALTTRLQAAIAAAAESLGDGKAITVTWPSGKGA